MSGVVGSRGAVTTGVLATLLRCHLLALLSTRGESTPLRSGPQDSYYVGVRVHATSNTRVGVGWADGWSRGARGLFGYHIDLMPSGAWERVVLRMRCIPPLVVTQGW